MTEFGICTMPRSIRQAVEMAEATEQQGFTAFGVGDGHFLHHDLYPVVTACLLATERVRIAPCTSNNVARSWSVHASSARALEELRPGRFMLGLATGDGSVRSIGLKPQTWTELAEDATRIREHVPEGLEIQCTASGLRGARSAGIRADSLVVGTGADAVAIAELAAAARSVQRDREAPNPIRVWALILAVVVDSSSEAHELREIMRVGAYATAHFAFASTFEGKNVPLEHRDAIRTGLSRYDYGYHGLITDANPNADLMADAPEAAEYLLDRMCLVGTESELRERLEALCAESGVDGIWLNAGSPGAVTRLAAIRP